MDVSEELTAEEMQELQKYIGAGAPTPDEKHNVHTFLNKVLNTLDTTRVGYLSEEELGMPKNPVRTFKKLSLISSKIMDNPYFSEFFEIESQNVTSTSLSKDAKLINLAVIQRRQLEDVTKKRKRSSSWFKRKDEKEETE